MPRYYFPSWDGDAFLADEEGLDFESIAQARAQASQALAEMARDILPEAPDGRVLKIRVMDGDGLVLELRLTYAVESGER
jgi:hypothetical protein